MRHDSKPLTSAMLALMILVTAGCGGGGGGGGGGDGDDSTGDDSGGDESGNADNTADLGISAVSNADRGSSYENAKADIHVDYLSLPYDNFSVLKDAIAYLDADGDGTTDIFMGTGEPLIEDEVDSELFLNDGSGNFNYSLEPFDGDPPPATHARKTLVADFDNDSLKDLLILDHGYDAPPFPGGTIKLVMQNTTGSFTWSEPIERVGFYHGGAAADVDNDGDIDVFVGGHDPFFLINDGSGSFRVVENRFETDGYSIFTAELIDVDQDGFVDLIVGGHEHDGTRTTIYWGNTTGAYTSDQWTHLPEVSDYGTVLDFVAEDFDGDGDRDIVVNRTGGGNDNFYEGRRVQLLENSGSRSFTDVTDEKVDDPLQETEGWVRWLRGQDYDDDGDIDVFSDNRGDDWYYENQGDGGFERRSVPETSERT